MNRWEFKKCGREVGGVNVKKKECVPHIQTMEGNVRKWLVYYAEEKSRVRLP